MRGIILLAWVPWCSARQQYTHPFQNITELELFFDANTGPGIWKWRHYFTIYDKHLGRFRGTDAKLIEIGIFSGGGLRMWRNYLGPKATIAGLDISPRVKTYDNNPAYGKPDRIFVGSQGDPKLWADIHQDVTFDAIIDDGAHTAGLQIATLDLAFKKLNPGGVYIVEDLMKSLYGDKFVKYVVENYVSGASGINACRLKPTMKRTPRERASGMDMKCPLISYEQKHVAEVAFYHNVVVITKLPRGTATTSTGGTTRRKTGRCQRRTAQARRAPLRTGRINS